MRPLSRLRRPGRTRSSRLRLGGVAALTALALGATACSNGGSESGDSGGAKNASGDFPAKVSTKFGEVSVKEQPKKVVALGWGDAETALALGVQPVAASDWLPFGGEGVGPWAKGRYDKKPKMIGTLEPEYEKIAELQPDLILDTKSSGDQKRYDTLSKIAPTVGVPKGGDQYMISWEQQTEMISTALGLKSKGEKLISRTKQKFAKAAKAHPEFKDKTITVGSRTSEGYGAYVSGAGRVDFVERLGFTNNPEVEKKAGKDFSTTVSRENLDLLDADLTVMAPIGISSKKITKDPLYRAIPAVKDGRSVVFENDDNLSRAFATDSVLSVSYALDKVVPVLAKAVDGKKD